MVMDLPPVKARRGCLSSERVVGETHLSSLLARVPWAGPRALYRLQKAGRGYPVTDWPAVVRAANRERPDVVSVDVFDTCLVRELVGDEAIERAIDRIDDGRQRDLIAAEMERRLCRDIPGVAESLELIRKGDAEVVFLSDTDRLSELLIEILRSYGIFVDGDRLVASCEAGATKSDGDLFGHTWPSAENGDRTIWHIGNHLWSDVAMAAASGIKPIPIQEADANRYELAMAAAPGGYGPAIAGAARQARLAIHAERRAGNLDASQAEVQSLGADVAGQTMSAFVMWVAEQCREEGIDHVGFLARDGELPLQLASSMPSDHWDDRRLLYLHCSRSTWSLAAAAALGVEQWIGEGTAHDDAFIHTNRHQVPLTTLLSRVGLGPEELVAHGGHSWLAGLDPTAPLPEFAVEDWDALLADQSILEQIEAKAEVRLKLIVDWLRAQNTPQGRYGLVDVGWRGRFASHISAVLTEVVGEDPVHFHFGGNKVISELEGRVAIRRFAFDGIADPHPIESPVSCVETLTASGKPRVVDYHRLEDGGVELVFDRALNGKDSDRSELWAGALRMAELIPSRADLTNWGLEADSLAQETVDVLDQWWNHPTAAEVEALNSLLFEHDEAGTAVRPLVAPYRLADLRRSAGQNVRQWPQGSVVASHGPMAGVAKLVLRGRQIRRKLGR